MCSEKISSSYFNSVQYEFDSRMTKSWTIPKGQSEALTRRRTDNSMDNEKGQSTICKTRNRKQKIEQHEPH